MGLIERAALIKEPGIIKVGFLTLSVFPVKLELNRMAANIVAARLLIATGKYRPQVKDGDMWIDPFNFKLSYSFKVD